MCLSLDQCVKIANSLDEINGNSGQEIALRLLKVGEEYGELCDAYIGVTGQNPRKGIYATPDDLMKEGLDTVFTVIVFLLSRFDVTDINAAWRQHCEKIAQRERKEFPDRRN